MHCECAALMKNEIEIESTTLHCIFKWALKANKWFLETFNPSSGYSLFFFFCPKSGEQKEWLVRLVSHRRAAADFLIKQAHTLSTKGDATGVNQEDSKGIKWTCEVELGECLFSLNNLCFSRKVWNCHVSEKSIVTVVFVYSISALGGSSALHIPAFPSGGCLIDYVPQVCHLLTNKVNTLCKAQFISVLCEETCLFVHLGIDIRYLFVIDQKKQIISRPQGKNTCIWPICNRIC